MIGSPTRAMKILARAARKIRELRPADLLVFALVWPLLCLCSFLPPGWAVRAGKVAGALGFYLDRRHRRVCLQNLRIAFPALRPAERWETALRAFENLGRTFLEFPGLGRQSRGDILGRIRYSGWEHYHEAVRDRKGVLLLTGHVGNWEMMALAHGFHGDPPLAFVARPLDNPHLERWVARVRGRSGNRMINKRGALRQVVRHLREGCAVGLLMDQNTMGPDSLFVDFFSTPTGSSAAISYLAVRSGARILPVYSVRDAAGTGHTICAEAPVPLQRTGRKNEDVLENTRRCQQVLEGIIRKHPDQWFWMHRRWKGSPAVKYEGK